VERDPFLINNSLVDGTPSPKISEGVRLKEMKICLNQNFMARVPEKHIRHSKEMVLQRRVANRKRLSAFNY